MALNLQEKKEREKEKVLYLVVKLELLAISRQVITCHEHVTLHEWGGSVVVAIPFVISKSEPCLLHADHHR